MPKPVHVPKPILHRASGQDVVKLRDPDGRRRMIYLGAHDSAEARNRYREVVARFLAGQVSTTAEAKAPPADGWPTVGTLCTRFLVWAHDFYRNEQGKLSREVPNFVLALEPVLDVLRDKPTDALTCADLETVRRSWVETEFGHKKDEQGEPIEGTGKRHCRGYVNSSMRRVRFVLRWGTEQGLVPGPTWYVLSAFRSLGIGRGGVRETDPVEAVPRAAVDAILTHLPPHIATAVELLWWSGMRAGELCNMRMRDIHRGPEVWCYRPSAHKGTWKGRERVVRFGPRCQELLRPLLKADPDAFLFSPAAAMRERKAAWREERRSRVQPTQQERDKRNAKKPSRYREQFDVPTLRRAVHRACDAAGVPRWGLHRLRHACGTRLVLDASDDAARLQLGHADERMVRRYSRAADSKAGTAVAVAHA